MKKIIIGLLALGSVSAMASDRNCKTVELGQASRWVIDEWMSITDYATYCADVNDLGAGKSELKKITVKVTNEVSDHGTSLLKANKRNAKYICKKLAR
jgi:hypothetical protein